MGIIRCEKGLHFYDNVKYDKCPYCEQRRQQICNNALQEQKTMALQPRKISELEEYICQQEKEKIDVNDYGRTIGYYSPVRGTDYVTGWLVCVEGVEKGRDYRLHHGFNRLGRGMNMDVIFSEDKSISRDTHCSIVYEGKTNHFYVVPGMETVTYVNQKLVVQQQELQSGDQLHMGDSTFEFIAFCREGHTWKEEK